ncbi:MAG: FlgD immunoglobulin-like domain containing protein, partial [Chthonomonadales bacterium]
MGYLSRYVGLVALSVISLCAIPMSASAQVTIQNSQVKASMDILGGLTVQDVHSTTAVTILKATAITLRVDGGPAGGGSDYAFGSAVGTFTLAPSVSSGHILARWSINGITGSNLPPIELALDISLVGDMVAIKFTTINGIPDVVPAVPGTASHSVGIKFAQNFSSAVVGANDGPVYLSNGGRITGDTTLTGSLIPDSWRNTDATLEFTAGGALRPTPGIVGFINPDLLIFGSAASLMAEVWDHTSPAPPGIDFAANATDAAAAVFWNPRPLVPGEQRDFMTYFGRQHATQSYSDPWGASVDTLARLIYDVSKPVGNRIQPNPFAVNATVTNNRGITLTNVTAVISLPSGLALATGETSSKNAGSVNPGAEGKFSWNVVPTNTSSGRQTISVSFSAGPGTQGKVITRQIDIPSLPSLTVAGGLSMFSVPYILDDGTPSVALGLNPSDFNLLAWNNLLNVYEAVSRIQLGKGYWLQVTTGKTINLQGAHPYTQLSAPFELKLTRGWQQFGTPFLFDVRWGDVLVVSSNGSDPNSLTPLTIDQAVQAGLILPTIYRYVQGIGYVFDQDLSTELVPFQAYWVRSLQDNVSLLIPPPGGRSAKVNRSVVNSTSSTNDWTIRLIASGKGSVDGGNILGVKTGSNDGYDLKDFQKPPAISGSVGLTFVRPEWGSRAAGYAQDIQAANGGRKVWNVVVTSPTPNADVTVSWPEIARVPRNYELTITDIASGTKSLMRQSTNMRVNTGSNASRAFQIVAEPRSGASSLFIRGSVSASGSRAQVARISVTGSVEATYTIKIRSSAGTVVRNLTSGRAATANTEVSYLWDGKDNRGTSLPSGIYQVVVTGTTPDGQV